MIRFIPYNFNMLLKKESRIIGKIKGNLLDNSHVLGRPGLVHYKMNVFIYQARNLGTFDHTGLSDVCRVICLCVLFVCCLI